MKIQTILKLLKKKYPEAKKYFLGAMLVLYDDGSGFIRGAGSDSNDIRWGRLFEFSKIEQLIQHLQEK